jgi:hypothetical protein
VTLSATHHRQDHLDSTNTVTSTCFMLVTLLILRPRKLGNIFLRNVSYLSEDYKSSYPTAHNYVMLRGLGLRLVMVSNNLAGQCCLILGGCILLLSLLRLYYGGRQSQRSFYFFYFTRITTCFVPCGPSSGKYYRFLRSQLLPLTDPLFRLLLHIL